MLKGDKELQVVGEAADGLEALQKAQTLQPDLILLDIGLPKLNGIDAARQILQTIPGVKIIFVSQDNDEDVIRAVLRAGAQGYVLKANAGTELLPAVAAVAHGHEFVSRGIKGTTRETARKRDPHPYRGE
jgi:DNA-binding NarL/FixJ family response regulator